VVIDHLLRKKMLPSVNSKGWEGQRPVRRRKSVTHYSDDNPQTFTTKATAGADAKVEAPLPKQRSVIAKKPGKRKACDDLATSSSVSTKLPEPPDNSVVHTAAYQPILPLQLFSWSNSQRISTTASLWSDRVVPPAGLAPKGPTWQEVASWNSSSTLPSSIPLPPITWFSLREDDRSYAIAGDAAGCLSLYHLSSSPTRPLIVLRETHAAEREFTLRRPAASESIKPVKRTFVSYPNAIVQCAWSRHIICVWTADELEVLYLSRNSRATSIAVWPVSQFQISSGKRSGGNQNATTTPCLSIAPPSLNAQSNIYRLLWTTLSTTDATSPTLLQADLSIQGIDSEDDSSSDSPWSNSISFDIRITPQLASVSWNSLAHDESTPWRCWTALWETPNSGETVGTILALAQTGSDTVELLRMRRIETTAASSDGVSSSPLSARLQILARQSVPSGRSNNAASSEVLPGSDYLWPIPDCCLQQFSSQPYTFLSAARGIRMYRTATLEAVALFGDTVQLHGKAVVWSRCAWVPAAELSVPVRVDGTNLTASSTTAAAVVAAVSKKKQTWWLERSDELAQREMERARGDALPSREKKEGEEDNIQEYWLLGVPHPYLGPSELRTSLYLWKPGAAAGDTTATLHLPAGGCLGDFFVAPECRRMVGVGAETSRLSEWQPILRTDFAGVMYPVGYKVIMDNLEYIEDEDELDEVMTAEEAVELTEEPAHRVSADSLALTVDPDLAEAMRLSLLELQQQQSDLLPRVDKISVSCDETAAEDSGWVVPCCPERAGMDGDEHSVTSSPKRGRALSHISLEDAFEDSFLQSLPQTRFVRTEVEAMQQKRSQQQIAVDSGAAVFEKTKAKPKRARTANIEALLQSSMDPNLRREMGLMRGIWAERTARDGALPPTSEAMEVAEPKSVSNGFFTGDVTNSSFVHGASPEEKSLALELLRLSPSPEMPDRFGKSRGVTNGHDAISEKESPSGADASFMKTQDTYPAGHGSNLQGPTSLNASRELLPAEPPHCRACMGRFVLHSCGLREKPIDYDAIARREREEKEREEEEKQRERELKRRLAEAKRRESRKQKKIDNERKKLLENQQLNMQRDDRFQRTEDERVGFVGNHSWEREATYHDEKHFAEGMEDPYNSEPTDDDNEDEVPVDNASEEMARNGESQAISHIYPSAGSWQHTQVNDDGTRHNEVVHIGGTEVNPSTSLHPMDALEALAGLADSMSKPVLVHTTAGTTPHHFIFSDNWNTNNATVAYTEQNNFRGYDTKASEGSFTATLQEEPACNVVYGTSDRLFSGSAAAGPILESFPSDDVKADVTPISHVDYREGGSTGMVTKLELSDSLNPTVSVSAPATLPSLHKPTMDSSLDQALILVEMAEAAVLHGPQQQHSPPNASLMSSESMSQIDTKDHQSTEQIKGVTEDHSQEAEALLAFALSASPKSSERPLVRLDGAWTPQIERRVTQQLYDFSPSQQPCFGSTSTTTHAIVVSQFLQQPMAAGLVNVTSAAEMVGESAENNETGEHDAILEEGTIS
jgi:hypothetical protein